MDEFSDRLDMLERQLAELRSRERSGIRGRHPWRALSIALAGVALTTVLLRPGTAQGNGNGVLARIAALEARVTTLEQQLDAERDARIAADTALEAALAAEAMDRQAADTALQSALSVETTARQFADTALQAGLSGESSARTAADTALQNQLDPLAFILAPFSRVGNNVIISGANLNVNNGLGSTETINGLGNVIIGYNEGTPGYHQRGGSHNLVVGKGHHYASYGGMVVGLNNGIFGDYDVVSGGQGNIASGGKSAVSGGALNRALGINSSVTGGNGNTAAAVESTVSGGLGNTAASHASSVSGGHLRTAPYQYDWVAGALFQND